MRLINADTLMEAMYNRAFETDGDTMWQSGCWVRYRAIEQTVKEQPTIEPERKKGKWYIDAEGDVRCTACKTKCLRDDIGINILSNFCPSCGARMDR